MRTVMASLCAVTTSNWPPADSPCTCSTSIPSCCMAAAILSSTAALVRQCQFILKLCCLQPCLVQMYCITSQHKYVKLLLGCAAA